MTTDPEVRIRHCLLPIPHYHVEREFTTLASMRYGGEVVVWRRIGMFYRRKTAEQFLEGYKAGKWEIP